MSPRPSGSRGGASRASARRRMGLTVVLGCSAWIRRQIFACESRESDCQRGRPPPWPIAAYTVSATLLTLRRF
jgi:hypothetical protein